MSLRSLISFTTLLQLLRIICVLELLIRKDKGEISHVIIENLRTFLTTLLRILGCWQVLEPDTA
jgi:hypothetical protein